MPCHCAGATNGAPICPKQVQSVIVAGAAGFMLFAVMPRGAQNYIKFTFALVAGGFILDNYLELIAQSIGDIYQSLQPQPHMDFLGVCPIPNDSQ